MDKAGIANRLSKAGMRNQATAYTEAVRQRILAQQGAKRDRDAASAAAWVEMWDTFRPAVEQAEKRREEAKKVPAAEPAAPEITGIPDDIDSALDPEYDEADPGKQLRDGLLWVVSEWMRIVRDTPEGPVISLNQASTPPPTAYALFVLSSYALASGDKRRDLISRSLTFATRGHDTAPIDDPADLEAGGFLDSLG